MSLSLRGFAVFAGVTTAFVIGSFASASATTFCVPGFHAGCPNSGGNVAESNLEEAMDTLSSDGSADRILIGPSTYTDVNAGGSAGTLEPTGTDPLEVIGSGTDQTFITSAGTGNQFVVNLNSVSRVTDMSKLTIIIPATFQDDGGAGIQAEDGTFDQVNIESRNDSSDGAPSLIGSVTWSNSRIYGAQGGSIDYGLAPNGSNPGKLEIVNTTIDDAAWGLSVASANVPVEFERSRITDPVAYGIRVTDGGQLTVENSVFETGGQEGISVETDNEPMESDIDVTVRSSTFVNSAPQPADPAIYVEIGSGFGSRNADVMVTESIFHGFENTWQMITPAGPGIGGGLLTLTDSNFVPNGLPDDDVAVDFSDPGNINQDPLFVSATDYRLKAGSPSIDAGDPGSGTAVDFDGEARPQDGDGDGSFIRDMGAFEAATIVTCANTPSVCPEPPNPPGDTTAPKVSKVKFKRATKKKPGALRLNLSEAATVKAVFKPTPAKKKGQKKRKTVKLSKKGKAGANRLVIKKRKLKPGRYRLTVTATDAAGNRSKPVVRKIKVKG